MATNYILPFAAGAGANVLTDAAWAASDVLAQGFQTGRAASIKYNKALRQSTSVASGFGQFTADWSGIDFSDSLSPQAIRDNFRIALAAALDGARMGVDTSSVANQITFTLTPLPTTLSGNKVIYIKPAVTNTGATTVQVTGSNFATLPFKRANGSDPQAGDLVQGTWYATVCDGTAFRALDPLNSDFSANASIASIPGRTLVFTASGSFTVPAGVTQVEVELVGGAGGAGASGDGSGGGVAGNIGGGGSAGGYCYRKISGLSPGAVIPVTIGAAGQGVAGANGTAGGTTSFGAYCSATGGGRGYWGASTLAVSDAAGTGVGGDINIPGQAGGFSGPNYTSVSLSDALRIYARGGTPPKGWGTVPVGGSGAAGVGYGAGGSGASGGSGLIGGNGTPGIAIVRW